jgi:hypothetical protein
VKTASKLLSVAFALAAATAVAIPMAQPAEAAGGPDIQTRFSEIRVSGGLVFVHPQVTNIGGTKSTVLLMQKFCGYLLPSGLVQENALGMVETLPALDPGKSVNLPAYTCVKSDGQIAVSARVLVTSAGDGDVNTANNEVKKLTFSL